MVVLVVLLVPVGIGVFLLAMERLEFELIGTTPTAGSEDVLLTQWSGASLRAGTVVFLGQRHTGGEDGLVETDVPERLVEAVAGHRK